MKNVLLTLIRFYQRTSFLHAPFFKTVLMSQNVCRFTPTCSDYAYQAIETYGSIKGSYLAIKRIIRCNPWTQGGYDPIP